MPLPTLLRGCWQRCGRLPPPPHIIAMTHANSTHRGVHRSPYVLVGEICGAAGLTGRERNRKLQSAHNHRTIATTLRYRCHAAVPPPLGNLNDPTPAFFAACT